MTAPDTPHGRIAELVGRAALDVVDELVRALVLPDGIGLDDVLSGGYPLTPSDLVAAADALDVPVTVLSGHVPMEQHLGVSLRLGRLSAAADVPVEALAWIDTLLGHREVLDRWLGPVESPLAGMPMHTDAFRLGAGARTADRVRRVLGLGNGPIPDLVGLVERLGYPVVFRELPEGLHGLNVRDERSGEPARVIVVSTRGGWPMQRYTLAHELCHALYDDPGQVIVDRVDVPEVLTELRAEAFARELLLPKRGLRQEWRQRPSSQSLQAFVANVMVRWVVSRDATVRALAEDGHIGDEDAIMLRGARVGTMIERAGLAEQWREVCGDENVQAGSPFLVDRAVRAFGNGWVSSWVVADVIGESVEATERRLAEQGWMSQEPVSG
jgi:Zn-dependent peptidase ImmA (M78 family)